MAELKNKNKKPITPKTAERERSADGGNTRGSLWFNVLIWVFFPIGLFRLFYKFLSKRFRMDITTKTSLLNSVMFFVLIVTYAVFVCVNVAHAVRSNTPDRLLLTIVIASIVIVLIFVAMFAAFSLLTGRSMLLPVRKMMNRLDEITAEDLSARLDPVDTQDELMELTDRINSMLDGLEESFVRQSNFVSDASHELRTPISVIQGYSDLLSRWGKDDPAILNEAIDAIRSEAANMKSIVEQLLYLAKLGSFRMQLREFDLAEVVRDIVEAYEMTNVDKTIVAHISSTIPVVADRSLSVELIRIITDNAIKYTPPGGKVDISAKSDGRGGAVVVVSDDGIGIAPEELPHIFDRFYRCDKARGRETGSTGLGLAIAKSIVEMMGGGISAKSALGKGSEFTITFVSHVGE